MITYQKALVLDFLEIARLDRVAWRGNRCGEHIPDGEHVWRVWVEHTLVFCAKNENIIVGVAAAFPCVSSQYCLHKIFVDHDFRKNGIGAKLLELVVGEMDNIGADCFLTVDPANTSAVTLYEKFGFSEKMLVKGYYRDNEDRYVMTRRRS